MFKRSAADLPLHFDNTREDGHVSLLLQRERERMKRVRERETYKSFHEGGVG